jgi:hypothetical protein
VLAVLEVRVHLDLDWDMLPDNYVLVAIDTETFHELPDDPRAIGYPWIESRGFALLRVRARILRVNRLPRLTPAFSDKSTSWRADRRSDPTPSDRQRQSVCEHRAQASNPR